MKFSIGQQRTASASFNMSRHHYITAWRKTACNLLEKAQSPLSVQGATHTPEYGFKNAQSRTFNFNVGRVRGVSHFRCFLFSFFSLAGDYCAAHSHKLFKASPAALLWH